MEGAPGLFVDRRSRPDTSEEALKAELYQQIGQLQVELDWLKKSPACRVRTEASMDRRAEGAEHPASVSVGRSFAVGVVLRGRTRDRRESGSDAADRRAVHANAVLRGAEDSALAVAAGRQGESEAGAAANAADGAGSDLPETAAVPAGGRTPDTSLPRGGAENRSAPPGG